MQKQAVNQLNQAAGFSSYKQHHGRFHKKRALVFLFMTREKASDVLSYEKFSTMKVCS